MKNLLSVVATSLIIVGCASKPKDLVSEFTHPLKTDEEFHEDFEACGKEADAAGYDLKKGIFVKVPRRDIIFGCLEVKGWTQDTDAPDYEAIENHDNANVPNDDTESEEIPGIEELDAEELEDEDLSK